MLHLLQATVAIHMIWNSSAWEIFFLLYTWGCNTIPLYFVIQIIPVWPLGANSQLIPVSLWHILTILFLLLFFSLRNHLLLSDTTNVLGSSYKLPAPVLKSTISPRSLGSFHPEIRNQDSGE